MSRVSWVLRLTTAILLVGHGALAAVVQKPALAHHLEAVGASFLPLTVLGGFEIVLGLAILLNASAPLLLFVLGWKVATELLYPISGTPFWEFIERGGSYAAHCRFSFWARSAGIRTNAPLPVTGHPVLLRFPWRICAS